MKTALADAEASRPILQSRDMESSGSTLYVSLSILVLKARIWRISGFALAAVVYADSQIGKDIAKIEAELPIVRGLLASRHYGLYEINPKVPR